MTYLTSKRGLGLRKNKGTHPQNEVSYPNLQVEYLFRMRFKVRKLGFFWKFKRIRSQTEVQTPIYLQNIRSISEIKRNSLLNLRFIPQFPERMSVSDAFHFQINEENWKNSLFNRRLFIQRPHRISVSDTCIHSQKWLAVLKLKRNPSKFDLSLSHFQV